MGVASRKHSTILLYYRWNYVWWHQRYTSQFFFHGIPISLCWVAWLKISCHRVLWRFILSKSSLCVHLIAGIFSNVIIQRFSRQYDYWAATTSYVAQREQHNLETSLVLLLRKCLDLFHPISPVYVMIGLITHFNFLFVSVATYLFFHIVLLRQYWSSDILFL